METNWWKTFFNADYEALFLRPSATDLSQVTDFIIKNLELIPGDKLFDQCCGNGDVSLALAQRKLEVLGIDLNSNYIHLAQTKQKKLLSSAQFVLADASKYLPESPCEAVINWHTSFGYSADDKQNQVLLDHGFEALKPGGNYLLDYYNADFVEQYFQPVMTKVIQGRTVSRYSEIDSRTKMLKSRWVFDEGAINEKILSGQTRFYRAEDLLKMLEKAGFTNFKLWGGIEGGDFSATTSRCIIKAHKGI